jgi:MFS_1 like family
VALAGVFHSLLLHVDARTESSTQSGFNSSVPSSGQLVCNRTGSFLQFASNETICDREELEFDVSATWRPFECETWCQKPRMKLCNSQNCTGVILNSTSTLELDFQVEEVELSRHKCWTRIGQTLTGHNQSPSTLLCNCKIQCPVQINDGTFKEFKVATNTTESDRAKHVRGFWIYFAVRIFASMSLSTSLSMLDATAICMVKMYSGDLGKQRIFGVVGQAVMAMIAGILLDWTVSLQGHLHNRDLICMIFRLH